MKKVIISILYLTGIMLVACNPMKDINDQLDAKGTTYVQSVSDVLTTADYEAMKGNVAKNHAFSATDPAANYVPAYLKSKYPGLTPGSVDKVTYNFKNAYPVLTADTTATKYTLTDADYAVVSTTVGVAKYFSPLNPADKYLPGILKSSVTGAKSGDLYLVSYMYSDVEPKEAAIQNVNVYTNDFATNLGDFTAYSVTGAQNWGWTSYSGDGYAKISGYASGANQDNEDWLVSPQIDLTGITNTTFNITQTAKYVSGFWNQLTVQVSTDFSGDPTKATWTTLTLPSMPTGSDWTFVNSGDVDLKAFDGKKIYIGIKYVSNSSAAATWEVTDVAVNGQKVITKSGKILTPTAIEEFYTYTTSWKKATADYYLTMPDYDAMGETSGKPGQYNNFSSSINPDNYLGEFLNVKFPFGQEGEIMNVVYKYYTGKKTVLHVDQYLVINGVWTKYNPVVVKTDQFILANTNEWVFDPTVNYAMTNSDYQIVVDYVKAKVDPKYVSTYGNDETYYGSSAYYGEFQANSAKFNAKFATWQDAVKEAMQLAFLPGKFPNAASQVDGIDVDYKITFALYDGTMKYYVITYQCTKSGPNPQFTYVSGPTAK